MPSAHDWSKGQIWGSLVMVLVLLVTGPGRP